MIVIGTDTHKRSHALAAVDEGTGRVRGCREITAEESGHRAAVGWARGLDEEFTRQDLDSVLNKLDAAQASHQLAA